MYFSLIIVFILVLGLIIAGIQNTMPVELTFLTWKFQLSLLALIFYSSLIGGAIIAVLTLPKLVGKSIKVKRLNREIYALKKRAVDLEKDHDEVS